MVQPHGEAFLNKKNNNKKSGWVWFPDKKFTL